MTRETFIIGSKEYAASKIPAFQHAKLGMKIKSVALPILGCMASSGKVNSVMDMDFKVAAKVISESLDESVIDEIIMPMFKLAQVASITDNVKIDSEINFNKVFTHDDGLADLCELVSLVLKFNYGNFFPSLANRFGGNGGAAANS